MVLEVWVIGHCYYMQPFLIAWKSHPQRISGAETEIFSFFLGGGWMVKIVDVNGIQS